MVEESDEYWDEETDETFKNNLVKRVKEVPEKEEESNKESTEKLTKELVKEWTKKSNKESDNEPNKEWEEESIEDLKETFDLNNKSAENWYGMNKFKKILSTIDSNKFNHKNEIGQFEFNDINNLISNIRNNTISDANAKRKINDLNEIKNVETKGKRLIKSEEKLLRLSDDLVKAILNNNNKIIIIVIVVILIIMRVIVKVWTMIRMKMRVKMRVKKKKNENEGDDEKYYEIKQTNNNFKKIDETKSYEDQKDILKKIPWLNDYWYIEYYEDNKETNLRLFKLKFAHTFNDVDDNLFRNIWS